MRVLRPFDPWGNPWCRCSGKYTFNPYTGCGHRCQYCYITSYIKNAFNPRLKDRVIRQLALDLRDLGRGGVVALSYSSDPYTQLERKYEIMRPILKLFREYGWRVLIATKSNLVVRDIDIIRDMNAAVSITITTLDRWLASKLEPGAPSPSDRLDAISELSQSGINVSVRVDPIVPYLNDDSEMIRDVVEAAVSSGAKHVVASVYKAKPDSIRRIVSEFEDVGIKILNLYRQGFRFYGYGYAPSMYRYRVLSLVREVVKTVDKNVSFNVCREGFLNLDDPNAYCDARHLL